MFGLISKLRRLYTSDRGIFYVVVGNIVASILGAIFWLILASLLTTEDYGSINYSFAIAVIAADVSLLGLNTMIMTLLPKGLKILEEAASILSLANIFSFVILILLFPGNWHLGLIAVSISSFVLSTAMLLGEKKYKHYMILFSLQKVAQIAISIILFFFIGKEGLILGYGISYILFAYPFLLSLRKFTLKFTLIREHNQFLIHNFLLNMSQQVSVQIDKILILPLFGNETLGLYQLGYQVVMFLGIVPSSMFNYLLPEESGGNKDNRIVWFAGISSSVAISLIAYVSLPWFIANYFPKFIPGIQAAQLMSFSVIPMSISTIFSTRLLATKNSKKVLYVYVMYIASQTLLYVILGQFFGLLGLALATLTAWSLNTVFYLLIAYHSKSYRSTNEDPSEVEV